MAKYIEEAEWSKLEHSKAISAVIRSTSTINWSFKTSKGWSVPYGGGCCGSMPTSVCLSDPSLSAIIVSLRTPHLGNPTSHQWWWDNILSKETSPWHTVLPEGGATIYKSGVAWAFEIPINGEMSFSNTINMFIATRQTMVEPQNTGYIEELYRKLKKVDDTVTFAEALAMGVMTYGDDIMVLPQKFITGNGYLGTAGRFSPRHMAQRKFVSDCGPSKKFKVRSYHPSCATWANINNYDAYRAFLQSTVTKDTVTEKPFFTYNVYGNSMQTTATTRYRVGPVEFLAFLRGEIV